MKRKCLLSIVLAQMDDRTGETWSLLVAGPDPDIPTLARSLVIQVMGGGAGAQEYAVTISLDVDEKYRSTGLGTWQIFWHDRVVEKCITYLGQQRGDRVNPGLLLAPVRV
jgi:hypothetical protein